MRRTLLAALVLGVASPARAVDVEGSLRILNRFNHQRDMVQTFLLYDEAARRFRVEDYLLPSVTQSFSTHVVAGLLDLDLGRGWTFTLSADSGALRVGPQYVVDRVPFFVNRRRVNYEVVTTRTQLELVANGVPFSEEAERSLFVREAFFGYGDPGGIRTTFGKRRVILGDGFLYDQYTFGIGLRMGPPRGRWLIDFDGVVADGNFDAAGKRSPVLHIGARYLPGPLQHFGLTLVYFHDGDSLLSEVFRASINEASIELANRLPGADRAPLLAVQVPVDSSGDILWFGLSGKRFLGDHTFGGMLLGQYAKARVRAARPAVDGFIEVAVEAVGVLADLYHQYDLTEDLVLGSFFTFVSGDAELVDSFRRRQSPERLTAFLSVFPFVTRANLFFNGGLNAEFTLRKASTVGVNARGVVAGGAWVRWDTKRILLEGRAVALGAHRPSIYDGRYYGTELDLSFRLPFARQVSLVGEVDALFTGSFFAAQRTVLQLIVGIDASLP